MTIMEALLNSCLTISIVSDIQVFGYCSVSFGVVQGPATFQDLGNSLGSRTVLTRALELITSPSSGPNKF
jgi:hypothetical protein